MRNYVLGSSLVTTALLSSVAWAQSTTAAFELEEITVTATKRETDLQKTAMSVTAITGDSVRKTGRSSLEQILDGVAGLEMQANGGGQGNQFYIRGVGAVPTFGQDAAVTTSINGVFQQQAQNSRAAMYDLGRIEVSRGPQSTLQGRNALGGAVNIVSAEPILNYEGSGTFGVGNYGLLSSQGMLNLPVTDTVAVRAAFSSEKRDGYMSNGTADSDVAGGRVRALYQPSDDFKVVLTADYNKQSGAGASASNTGIIIPNAFAASGFSMGRYCTPSLSSVGTYPASNCAGLLTLSSTGTVTGVNAVAYNNLPVVSDRYWTANPEQPQQRNFKSIAYSMDLNWNLGWANLYFQPTYMRTDYKVDTQSFNILTYATRLQQAISAPVPNVNPYAYAATAASTNGKEQSYQRQSTYELRLTSPEDADSAVKWLGGVYYFKNRQATNVSMGSNLYCNGSVCSTTAPNQPSSAYYAVGVPAFDAILDHPLVPLRFTKDYAAYAGITYSVTEALRLTASARYTEETKWRNAAIGNAVLPSGQVLNTGFTYRANDGVAGTTTGAQIGYGVDETKATWSNLDYRGVIEYDITSDSMVYGSISTGFKGGSFMQLPVKGLSPGFRNYYDPEYLTAYEVGFRNELFDRTLRANLSAFYYDYTDYQYQYAASGVFDPVAAPALYDPVQLRPIDPDYTFNYTANASDVTSYGGELELNWVATDRDQVGLNVSYTHGRFGNTTLPGGTASSVATAASLKGVPLPSSPEWSVAPSYKHRFDLGQRGSVTAAVDANYKSKMYLVLTGNQAIRDLFSQESVTKYNTSLSYDAIDGNWNVTAYVRNLTDEATLTTAAGTGTFNPASSVPTTLGFNVSEPRTFGLTITASFD